METHMENGEEIVSSHWGSEVAAIHYLPSLSPALAFNSQMAPSRS